MLPLSKVERIKRLVNTSQSDSIESPYRFAVLNRGNVMSTISGGSSYADTKDTKPVVSVVEKESIANFMLTLETFTNTTTFGNGGVKK